MFCLFFCHFLFLLFIRRHKKVNVSAAHCWTIICVSPAGTLFLLSDLDNNRGCSGSEAFWTFSTDLCSLGLRHGHVNDTAKDWFNWQNPGWARVLFWCLFNRLLMHTDFTQTDKRRRSAPGENAAHGRGYATMARLLRLIDSQNYLK